MKMGQESYPESLILYNFGPRPRLNKPRIFFSSLNMAMMGIKRILYRSRFQKSQLNFVKNAPKSYFEKKIAHPSSGALL
jgi:hypothetical protein